MALQGICLVSERRRNFVCRKTASARPSTAPFPCRRRAKTEKTDFSRRNKLIGVRGGRPRPGGMERSVPVGGLWRSESLQMAAMRWSDSHQLTCAFRKAECATPLQRESARPARCCGIRANLACTRCMSAASTARVRRARATLPRRPAAGGPSQLPAARAEGFARLFAEAAHVFRDQRGHPRHPPGDGHIPHAHARRGGEKSGPLPAHLQPRPRLLSASKPRSA